MSETTLDDAHHSDNHPASAGFPFLELVND